jgi:hypothetical protein
MHREDMLRLLRLQPPRPLRLVTTDGRVFNIRHPELCVPGDRSVFIGFPSPTAEGTELPGWERFVLIDRSHVVSLEPIEEPTAAPNS